MQRLKAFKYELMPTGEQQRQMRRFAGSCRFVFNQALALQQANRDAGGTFIGYVAMAKQLTDWRNGAFLPSGQPAPWLKDAPVHPLQHALKNLKKSLQELLREARRVSALQAQRSERELSLPRS